MRSPAVASWHGTTGLGSCPDRRHRTGSTFDLSAIFDFRMKSKRQNHSGSAIYPWDGPHLKIKREEKILRMRPYGGCTGDPSEIRNPRPLSYEGWPQKSSAWPASHGR